MGSPPGEAPTAPGPATDHEDTRVVAPRTIPRGWVDCGNVYPAHERSGGGASTRQIVVPEQAGRDRSPRPPDLAHDRQLIGGWTHRKALGLRHRGRQGHVPGGPHVGATEDHQQIDRGRPPTDARDGLEGLLRCLVVHPREPIEVQRTLEEGRGDGPTVTSLLATEPDGEQLRIGQPEEPLRRQWIGRADESVERSTRGGEGDLLLEHDVYERAEARRAIPERWRSDPRDDAGKVRVAGRELRDGRLEAGLVERRDQVTVPRSLKPTDGSGSNGRSSAPRSHARVFSPSDGRW